MTHAKAEEDDFLEHVDFPNNATNNGGYRKLCIPVGDWPPELREQCKTISDQELPGLAHIKDFPVVHDDIPVPQNTAYQLQQLVRYTYHSMTGTKLS